MSSGGTSHSLVARLSTQRPGELRIRLSSVVRSAPGTMPSEGMQGHEWGAYVVLDTFLLQARFWSSGGQGDLPTDCGGMCRFLYNSTAPRFGAELPIVPRKWY